MATPASHQVAIARASLAAALLRADPTPISRDEIAGFHSLLENALNKCSVANVQVDTFMHYTSFPLPPWSSNNIFFFGLHGKANHVAPDLLILSEYWRGI
jgi:hypothetical protein